MIAPIGGKSHRDDGLTGKLAEQIQHSLRPMVVRGNPVQPDPAERKDDPNAVIRQRRGVPRGEFALLRDEHGRAQFPIVETQMVRAAVAHGVQRQQPRHDDPVGLADLGRDAFFDVVTHSPEKREGRAEIH